MNKKDKTIVVTVPKDSHNTVFYCKDKNKAEIVLKKYLNKLTIYK